MKMSNSPESRYDYGPLNLPSTLPLHFTPEIENSFRIISSGVGSFLRKQNLGYRMTVRITKNDKVVELTMHGVNEPVAIVKYDQVLKKFVVEKTPDFIINRSTNLIINSFVYEANEKLPKHPEVVAAGIKNRVDNAALHTDAHHVEPTTYHHKNFPYWENVDTGTI